jgi:delta24(24(1))-sterol reductase
MTTMSFSASGLASWDNSTSLGVVVGVAVVAAPFFLSKKKGNTKVKNVHKGDGTLLEALSHLALFAFSHVICYYLWWSAEFNKGCLGNPFPLQPGVIEKATPNTLSVGMYFGISFGQLIYSATLPGPTVLGFPIPQEDNRRRAYKCNGLAGWYLTLAISIAAHWTGLFDLKVLYRNSGAMLTTAILFADLVAVIMYLECIRTRRSDGTLQNFPHDFVMGQYLNPRIGNVDLKMWAEIRVSWLLLFALDVSCALCAREDFGYIPNRMWIILLIHGLYTNACMKGEESIPYTWDIFQECWGWMLIYWNLAGVAFAYTFNGRFIYSQHQEELPNRVFLLLVIGVLISYWVFDEANAQKNRFRAQKLSGAYVKRPWAFPQLPNATLENPKYMTTARGSTLLMDGWWQYVRKPHYTADLCLAVLLCLPCGFGHFLPFFFACFFLPMLVHREKRDSARCAEKYGNDWVKYCEQVPYTLIPGIY